MLGQFDLDILRYLQDLRTPFFNLVFEYLSKIAEAPVCVIIVSFIYYVIDKELGCKLLYTFGNATTFNNTVKNFVKIPRAFRDESSGITCVYPDTATGYSFPSGHSQQISSLTFGISNTIKKVYPYIISIILSLLVAFSRVYLGCHYMSDVIVGLLVGVIMVIVSNLMYKKLGKDKAYLFSIIIFSICAIIFYFDKDFSIHFKDMYSSLALLVGGFIGYKIENKYVNFDNSNIKIGKRILRWIISVAIMGIVYLLLSVLFKMDIFTNNAYVASVCSFIKYTIVIALVVGVCPIILKKVK